MKMCSSGFWECASCSLLSLPVSSKEEDPSLKLELTFEELEQRLDSFSQRKDNLQELMLEFKGELEHSSSR